MCLCQYKFQFSIPGDTSSVRIAVQEEHDALISTALLRKLKGYEQNDKINVKNISGKVVINDTYKHIIQVLDAEGTVHTFSYRDFIKATPKKPKNKMLDVETPELSQACTAEEDPQVPSTVPSANDMQDEMKHLITPFTESIKNCIRTAEDNICTKIEKLSLSVKATLTKNEFEDLEEFLHLVS